MSSKTESVSTSSWLLMKVSVPSFSLLAIAKVMGNDKGGLQSQTPCKVERSTLNNGSPYLPPRNVGIILPDYMYQALLLLVS